MGNPAGVRRDFEALEKRRFQAIRLLDEGLNQSEVARTHTMEYIWAYWKQHELPNVCPKDYWQLSEGARRTLRRLRRRPRLTTAFWKQASLWPSSFYITRDSVVFTLLFRTPTSSPELALAGKSLATGLPRFAIRIPSGVTESKSARHCSLNFEALIVGTVPLSVIWQSLASVAASGRQRVRQPGAPWPGPGRGPRTRRPLRPGTS